MNLALELASEQLVDHAVLSHQVLVQKIIGDDDDLEVRFRARWHVVLAALVDDLQMEDLEAFGDLLHQGWELKRSLGFGISNAGVDDWYAAARANGAMGGKLLGAGGGGFLMIMAPPENHAAIRAACGHPKELPFSIDRRGSRVIFISDRYAF